MDSRPEFLTSPLPSNSFTHSQTCDCSWQTINISSTVCLCVCVRACVRACAIPCYTTPHQARQVTHLRTCCTQTSMPAGMQKGPCVRARTHPHNHKHTHIHHPHTHTHTRSHRRVLTNVHDRAGTARIKTRSPAKVNYLSRCAVK